MMASVSTCGFPNWLGSSTRTMNPNRNLRGTSRTPTRANLAEKRLRGRGEGLVALPGYEYFRRDSGLEWPKCQSRPLVGVDDTLEADHDADSASGEKRRVVEQIICSYNIKVFKVSVEPGTHIPARLLGENERAICQVQRGNAV